MATKDAAAVRRSPRIPRAAPWVALGLLLALAAPGGAQPPSEPVDGAPANPGGVLDGARQTLELLLNRRRALEAELEALGLPPEADERIEQLPPAHRIPLAGAVTAEQLQVRSEQGRVTLVAHEVPLRDVLMALVQSQGLNVVFADDVDGRVTLALHDRPFLDALDSILGLTGYTWAEHRGILHVSQLATSRALPAALQDRRVEVFRLDFTSATDVNRAITNLLSPVGHSYVIESDSRDNRLTVETLVVEDLPPYLDRIRRYVARVDEAPRQVLIEARVLQIELEDESRHGVNWNHLFTAAGHPIRLRAQGFANDGASPAFFAELSAGNLETLIESLKTTTDAKTLANPRLMVINGQEASIQIGERLPYITTTVTQTDSTETVNFLEVGTILHVTPRISRDGRIMLRVRPKISSGRINEFGLPQEETTEVETDVLLLDNQGIVIGGLIKELDHKSQSKLPWVGDLRFVGRLFQRRLDTRRRTEVVVTLLPRILPYDSQYQGLDEFDVIRAETPILHGPLKPYPRRFEPALPDAVHNPHALRLPAPDGSHRAEPQPSLIRLPRE